MNLRAEARIPVIVIVSALFLLASIGGHPAAARANPEGFGAGASEPDQPAASYPQVPQVRLSLEEIRRQLKSWQNRG